MHHSPVNRMPDDETKPVHPLHPIGAVAAMIAKRVQDKAGPFVYIAETGRRRQDIVELAAVLCGPGAVAEFAAPDGFPGDGMPVTAAIAGNRMATLSWLRDSDHRPSVVVTTPAALIRKVPPRASWTRPPLEIRTGEALDTTHLAEELRRIGYWLDDRVDEPGEAAFRGRVVETFPAAAPRPCRIEYEDGRVTAIRSYDPATQRSVAETDRLIVDPASECVPCPSNAAAGDNPDHEAPDFLCRHYDALETLFDYLPDAEIVLESGAGLRADEVFEALDRLGDDAAHAHAIAADHLDRESFDRLVGDRTAALVEAVEADHAVPVFALDRQPFKAFAAFAAPFLKEGYRIVVAGRGGRALKNAGRKAAKALGCAVEEAEDWAAVTQAEPGALLVFAAPLAEGFRAPDSRILAVSLRDLEGQRAELAEAGRRGGFQPETETFATGDRVVHVEHGVAILDGLAPIDANGDAEGEALVLRYARDETLLVPMADIGALWRYGGPSSEVALDRLKAQSWARRRDDTFAAIATTAARMVERLTEKARAKAVKLKPDRVAFERFCARFPYDLTGDQARAAAEVLADLASGRPMDRLVCGDVGYGKTEVALRAAAAAVFAGRQVAVLAPTTVLAQQHYRSFVDRFSPQGVEVVRLSRLVGGEEAKAARRALKAGEAKIIVGTHAILSDDVAFDDLALVVVDEEQRFGSAHKAKARALADGVHVLTMTATPIPRTLQAGFVGLSDLSIIATPPMRRSPVRTEVGPFDAETVRAALAAEKARGGQSFVVCPRIEDLEPMAKRLSDLVPDQSVATLHGRMKPEEVEDAMLAFAAGDFDILLATTIVESGLDVANANMMVVCRADRFGLAELHQLRGRVGRGTRRGHVLLTTEAEAEIGEEARERLAALAEFDSLGAGFDIAARDLDLRGTGELLGDEQAGHLQTIGIGLYRKTLEHAIALAKGEPERQDARPIVAIGVTTAIPADYVPEPDMRIELAVLLERVADMESLDGLRTEIEDRFGPMPGALEAGFRLAELRLRCESLAVSKLDLGPKAAALAFTPDVAKRLSAKKSRLPQGAQWSNGRLVFPANESDAKTDGFERADAVLDQVEEAECV